nr:MAG TPA: Protein of unknown function (DUF3161) [Caudoviricetes sp.]
MLPPCFSGYKADYKAPAKPRIIEQYSAVSESLRKRKIRDVSKFYRYIADNFWCEGGDSNPQG